MEAMLNTSSVRDSILDGDNSTPPCHMLFDFCRNTTSGHSHTPDGRASTGHQFLLDILEDIFYIVITPGLCIFGCIGNVINLIVLTKIRLRMRKMDGSKENITHLGLTLLAISDLMFCLSICPRGFSRLSSSMSLFETKEFRLYYQTYGTGFVTTFILTSTWITVAMAALRYFGICHPLASRRIDSVLCGRVAYCCVILSSAVINLPAFWHFKIDTLDLDGNGQLFFLIDLGFFAPNRTPGKVFQWTRAIYGIFIPALALGFCNFSLIATLRQSHEMRRACRVQDSASKNSSRITLLLVVLVVMFVVLVFPSELMDFFSETIKQDAEKTETFMVVRGFANVLQVFNFAVNFVLYCIMNVHFRSTLQDLCRCRGERSRSRRRTSTISRSNTTSVTLHSSFFRIPGGRPPDQTDGQNTSSV